MQLHMGWHARLKWQKWILLWLYYTAEHFDMGSSLTSDGLMAPNYSRGQQEEWSGWGTRYRRASCRAACLECALLVGVTNNTSPGINSPSWCYCFWQKARLSQGLIQSILLFSQQQQMLIQQEKMAPLNTSTCATPREGHFAISFWSSAPLHVQCSLYRHFILCVRVTFKIDIWQ